MNTKFQISARWQAGQTLLVVVLVMVVALTVGLSVAVRTMTNIRTTSEEEDSQRAFSAAEAGIERSLGSSPVAIPETTIGPAKFQTAVAPVSGDKFILNNGTIVLKDEPIDVWLSTHPTYANPWPTNGSENLTINWGSSATACTPGNESLHAALEIIIITTTTPADPKTNNKVTTYAFDPCGTATTLRRGTNNFSGVTTPGNTINGQVFLYKTIITIPSTSPGLIARIIPLYAPALVGIEGSIVLPSQGTTITSTGTSGTTKRKIVSFRGFPKIPLELFPFVIFSP